MMKVLSIDPGSPLFGYVRPGYRIVSVNGTPVIDTIDFHYKIAEERVTIVFADSNGKEIEFEFSEDGYVLGSEAGVGEEVRTEDGVEDEGFGDAANEGLAAGLGITLEDSKVKTCKCDCIFCFVRQQPRGMRKALYVKDEDYRLSFTHGNFITLSNMTEEEIERIVEQRLSPLYVSVHATDDRLRRCMLRNERLAPIVPRLRYLGENGITIHTQVVLCPEINDGEQLARTVDDLVELYPSVETLGVVPVGLTKYRERQAKLRTYTQGEASGVIDYIEGRQREFVRERGSRFVWPADEFYVIAGREFPRRVEYEEMNQFENGIGMARETMTWFNYRKGMLRKMVQGAGESVRERRVLFLTGESAQPILERTVGRFGREELKLRLMIGAVRNEFWGHTVTVSGLLTGQDLLRYARKHVEEWDVVVVPPNCLNDDDLFLDNLSLEQFRKVLGKRVIVGQYNIAESIREAWS